MKKRYTEEQIIQAIKGHEAGAKVELQAYNYNQTSMIEQVFRHLMSVVEPVFGNIFTNKGTESLQLARKSKGAKPVADLCLIQNVEKLMQYGISWAK
jgi:hypothetical protein